MRVSKEQAARNRQAILETAGRLFRERGVDGVGVADLMQAAGFTHGGFYNHFESKDALAAAVAEAEIAASNRRLAEGLAGDAKGRARAWRRFVDGYLSRAHRDQAASGCPIAALAADAARQERPLQQPFACGLAEAVAILTELFGGGPAARRRGLAVYSELVGALVLSRAIAVADPALADEILEASRLRLRAP
jgi:TetR/AcrR family transcriptional repressor of nem operon